MQLYFKPILVNVYPLYWIIKWDCFKGYEEFSQQLKSTLSSLKNIKCIKLLVETNLKIFKIPFKLCLL